MTDEQIDSPGKLGKNYPLVGTRIGFAHFSIPLAHTAEYHAPYFVTLARPRRGERSSPALVVNWWGRPMRHLAWKQVVCLLTLAAIVRLGAAVYWHQHWHGQFVFGDSQGYFDLARAIAHGQPYQLAGGEQVFRCRATRFCWRPCCGYLTVPTRCGRRGSKAASSACSRCSRWPAGRGRSSVRGPHGSPV